MGCATSSQGKGKTQSGKKIKKPVWTSDTIRTVADLQKKREEFWDTQPHYGGDRVIWDALKAACDEPDPNMAATILDSAGVVVSKADLSECYDAKGFKYELPKFVVAPPQNLRPEIKAAVRQASAPETATRNAAASAAVGTAAAAPTPVQ